MERPETRAIARNAGPPSRCGTCSRRRRAARAGRCRRWWCATSTFRAASAASANTPSASRPRGPSSSSTISSTVTVAGLAGEAVAAVDAPLGADDPGSSQGREQLLEELHRDVPAAGQLADRHRLAVGAARQLGQGQDRVRGLRRDRDHAARSPVRRGISRTNSIRPATRPGIARRPAVARDRRRRLHPAVLYSQPRSVAIRTAWARSTAPSLP